MYSTDRNDRKHYLHPVGAFYMYILTIMYSGSTPKHKDLPAYCQPLMAPVKGYAVIDTQQLLRRHTCIPFTAQPVYNKHSTTRPHLCLLCLH